MLWSSRFRRGSIFALFGVVAVVAFYGSERASQGNSNRVEDWLPRDFQETKDLEWFASHFGGDDLLMVSWEGCVIDDPRVAALADLLRQPADVDGDSDVQLFRDVLTAAELLQELGETLPDYNERETTARLEGWLLGPDPGSGGERTSCLVLLMTKVGWQHRHAAVDHIYRCADRVANLSADQLRVAGGPMDSVAIDRASAESLDTLYWLSGAICFGIMWYSFRSLALSLMVFLVAVLSEMLSTAAVFYTGGTMDSILLMVPSLIYVTSISGGVHLANYYRDAVQARGLVGASQAMLSDGWVPCSLSFATSALGLVSLVISFLAPIQKFGAYGALGVVLSLGIMFLLLPALLEQFPPRRWAQRLASRAAAQNRPRDVWRPIATAVTSRAGMVLVATVILTMGGAWGLLRLRSTAHMHDMFFSDARILRDYEWLEQRVGPLVPIEIVLRMPRPATGAEAAFDYPMFDRLRLLAEVDAAVAQVESVGAVISAALLAPPIPAEMSPGQRLGLRELASRRALHTALTKHRAEFIENGLLRETDSEDLWRISARVRASGKHDYQRLLNEVHARVDPILLAAQPAGVSAVYSGAVPLVQKAQAQLLDDLLSSFLLESLFVATAMILLLRSIPAGLLAMIPNVFPCVVVFGAMGWLGMPIEAGSMMTATVAMGLAVDDTLHYLTWYRRAIRDGCSRQDAIRAGYEHCGDAMVQTTLIVGLGLLVYASSSFVPISRFAWLMFLLLVARLIGDTVVLPAILSSPLGKSFDPRKAVTAEAIGLSTQQEAREQVTPVCESHTARVVPASQP